MDFGPGIRWRSRPRNEIGWDPREPIPPSKQQHGRVRGLGSNHRELSNIEEPAQNRLFLHGTGAGQLRAVGSSGVLSQAQPRSSHTSFEDRFLPPLNASIKAQIIQDTAKVTITHLFSNNSNCIIPKAAYTFPLPNDCTITDFVCRIGSDKVLKGTAKSKDDALKTFKREVKQGRHAGLLEQNTAEIFTIQLGTIPADVRLKIEISFVSLLKYNRHGKGNGLTIFTLPLCIAPRFGSPPPEMIRTSNFTKFQSLQIEVDILSPEEIISIKCDTHATSIERGAGTRKCQSWEDFGQPSESTDKKSALVRLEETVKHLDRDFVLYIETRSEASLEQPQAWIETHPTLENHRTVMLTIPREFMLNARRNTAGATSESRDRGARDSEIIFLADRSGSMDDKMIPLKSAMKFFLKGIPTDRLFNIWSFGTDYKSMWHKSQRYSEKTLGRALGYVETSFSSDMGGTNLLPALKAIMETDDKTNFVDVVAITDGEVWDLDETLNFVAETRTKTEGRVRFFCVGIGDAVSHALVEGIGKYGGGYAEVIPRALAQKGEWEDHLVGVLEAALADHICDIEIELGDRQEDSEKKTDFKDLVRTHGMMRSPKRVCDLNLFLRNRVLMLFESLKPGAPVSGVHIRTRKLGEDPISTWVPLKRLKRDDTTLHKLAARALLGDLERELSHLSSCVSTDASWSDGVFSRGSQRESIAGEGERLGCKWSLVSKWTSFVAVEERVHPIEINQDPFTEGEQGITSDSQDYLDLLQPRGAQTARPSDGGLGLELLESEEEDGTLYTIVDNYGITGPGGSVGAGAMQEPSGSESLKDQSGSDNDTDTSYDFGISGIYDYYSNNIPMRSPARTDCSDDEDGIHKSRQPPPCKYSRLEYNGTEVGVGRFFHGNSWSMGGPSPLATQGGPGLSGVPISSAEYERGRPPPPSNCGGQGHGHGQKPPGLLGGPNSVAYRRGGPLPPARGLGTTYRRYHIPLPRMAPTAALASLPNSTKAAVEDGAESPPRTLENYPTLGSPSGPDILAFSQLRLTRQIPAIKDAPNRDFIKSILEFQSYDGSFVIASADARKLFRDTFWARVKLIHADVEQKCELWGSPTVQQLALTVSIIALLETHFQEQKPLWVLLAAKARSFIKSILDAESSIDGGKVNIEEIIYDAKRDMEAASDLVSPPRNKTGVTISPAHLPETYSNSDVSDS
ncbi:hypothetical protein TWF481_000081 [Arthrobotrys musiformis]|uniref:VWFA domain-containing protein n=1 Tax=Arthrobotrys musiformis TaxID=47236 RepID=A0AAV9WMG1_9PEZI